MSLSAVRHAVRQGNQSAPEVALATGPGARCSRLNALSAAKTPKYPLNRVGINRCTVAIATANSDRVDKQGSTSRHIAGSYPSETLLMQRLRIVPGEGGVRGILKWRGRSNVRTGGRL
jgi:hypothetical protein